MLIKQIQIQNAIAKVKALRISKFRERRGCEYEKYQTVYITAVR